MSNSKKIAFQGEPGANSHIACIDAYPDYEPLPCPTFEDAFAAVRTRRASLGMPRLPVLRHAFFTLRLIAARFVMEVTRGHISTCFSNNSRNTG